jgi:pimeloyl-ACP methyl ester carboxylesterase
MSLNASIFPDLPASRLEVDFSTTVFDETGGLPERAPGMELYLRELERRLTESDVWRGARRHILIGHSFGGMLALEWLARHGPQAAKVMGAILIGTTAGPLFDVVRLRVLARHDVRIPITGLMALWNRPAVTKAMKRLMCGGSLEVEHVDFRALPHTTDAAVDAAGWRNTDWRAMRSMRLAMDGYDSRHLLSGIEIPVIVLHGSEDSLLPSEQGTTLARELANAELRLIRGAGHALPLTHGSDVRRAIDDLLDGRGPGILES